MNESIIDEDVHCISVKKTDAERARKILVARKLLGKGYRPKSEKDRVYFPVISLEKAISELEKNSIQTTICNMTFKKSVKTYERLSTIVKSYVTFGDKAVFSYNSKIPIEEYRKAALELLRNNKRIKGVFLKISTEGEFRIPKLVHLAGDSSTIVKVKEYGLIFEFDLSKVYYNPRLAEERRRVSMQVKDGEIILDMFCGIGVFPIHIASLRDAFLLANDLNPHAVNYLIKNIELNSKKLKGRIIPVMSDALLLDRFLKPVFDRIIMNNPTSSHLFLKTACSLAKKDTIIHYYRIGRECGDLIAEAEKYASCEIKSLSCRPVLDHGPGKYVYSIDFRIDK